MLTLSPSAVEAVDALLHNSSVPEEAGLRIAPASDTELTLGLATAPAPGDQIIEEGGARVFVDPGAASMLDGAELDAQAQGDQFAFGLRPQGDDGDDGGSGVPAGV
jgi:Fe-S cluster assembly iron-binding protein IscA